MDFLKILKSFDELLFELMAWLAFYPITMGRILLRPLRMMAYSDAQNGLSEETRYDDAISPPLLLMITLVLASGIALAVHAPSPSLTTPLGQLLHRSQENQLLFRCLTFALVPLVAAILLVRRRKQPLSRTTIKAPFYAQCYLAAPSALAVSIAVDAAQVGGDSGALAGAAIVLVATAWFLTVQTRWFATELSVSIPRGAITAIWAFVQALIYMTLIALPLTRFGG